MLLDVRAGLQKVCIEKIDSLENLKYTNEKGFAAPVYVGGGGKVLLSQLNDDQIEMLLNQISLVPITPNTIIDKAAIMGRDKKSQATGICHKFWREGARQFVCFGSGEKLFHTGGLEHLRVRPPDSPKRESGKYWRN